MANSSTALLSIVIATKNREFYCIETIKSILSFKSDLIQIAISDNSDTRQVEAFVDSICNKNIVYRYNNSAISSIDNFNYAMELASGEYVILIGDDDSVHPKIIELVHWIKENNIESVCSKDTFTFLWPGAHPNFPNGLIKIPKINDSYHLVDPKKELIKLLKNGLVNYFFYNVPKSYHGIIKKSIMDKIKETTGNYYGALSPDIFSAVCLSLILKNHCVLNYPITIAGVCPASTTSAQILGNHCGALDKMPHLKNRKDNYIWDSLVPKIYSVSTTWGDSGLHALTSIKRDDLKKHFNFYPLISQTIIMNRNYIFKFSIKKSEEFRIERKVNFFVFWMFIIFYSFSLILQKSIKTLKSNFNKKNIQYANINGFSDVFEKIGLLSFYNNK
ncbi:glycosyltransferase family 2 protein [Flavobacterium flavigenum]|uniref:glycosyltransferase family 2 protein n=1 Tax=Flavobacterium flavigenum TaxID=3003258 RepID=UPI002482C50E|nr:glycosyltransferase [Flavobacterium flavigenum]